MVYRSSDSSQSQHVSEERRLKKKANTRLQKTPKKGYATPEVYARLRGVPGHAAEELYRVLHVLF